MVSIDLKYLIALLVCL